jgi:hypothetical protein
VSNEDAAQCRAVSGGWPPPAADTVRFRDTNVSELSSRRRQSCANRVPPIGAADPGYRRAMRSLVVVLAVAVCLASATMPKPHDVDHTFVFRWGYDETWFAVVNVFSRHHWPIQTVDKASGLITTDEIDLGSDADKYADCGSDGLTVGHWTHGRFVVRFKKAGGYAIVTVDVSFKHFRRGHSFLERRDTAELVTCTSLGTVESLIHDAVADARARAIAEPREREEHAPQRARPDAGAVDAAAPALKTSTGD